MFGLRSLQGVRKTVKGLLDAEFGCGRGHRLLECGGHGHGFGRPASSLASLLNIRMSPGRGPLSISSKDGVLLVRQHYYPSLVVSCGCRRTLFVSPSVWEAKKRKGIIPIGEKDYGGYDEDKHQEYEDDAQKRQARIQMLKKIFSSLVFLSIFVGVMWARNRKRKEIEENTKYVKFLPKDDLFTGSKDPFCIVSHENGVDSVVLPSSIVQDGTLKYIRNMTLRQGDVVVASFPKTGTTWVQEIVYLIETGMNFRKAKANIEDRFPFLEYPYPGVTSIAKMKGSRLIKTHLPYPFLPKNPDGAKIIYVTRNPKDTAVSYYHFARMFSMFSFVGTFEEFIPRFMEGTVPFSPYFSHMESFIRHKDDPNVLIVSYEELSDDPRSVINKIAIFLEKPMFPEELRLIMEHTAFHNMAVNPAVNYQHWDDLGLRKKDEAKFMRKGKVGDWTNHFSNEMNESFDQWISENNKMKFKFHFYPIFN